MMKTQRVGPLMLLLLLVAVVSCGKNTADPNVTLGDVNVPSLVCPKAKTGVDIGVPLHVKDSLVNPQVCWVGIYEDLGFGDEVGDLIECKYGTFEDDITMGFYFDLPDGNYAVMIGVTENIGDECYAQAAFLKQGPKRMAVGGPGCDNPPKLATIEYDCMSGYDIRGPQDSLNNDNIYKYSRKRFDQGLMQLAFQEHSLSLPAQVFASANDPGGLNEYLLLHWSRRFLYDSTEADFYLLSIRNCVNRANFFGVGKPLSDSAVGLSGPLPGNPGELFGKQTGAWCLIFKEPLDSILNQGSRQKGYDRSAVHELGHALAGLTHPEDVPSLHNGGTNSDCVMGMMEYYLPVPGSIGSGHDKFCRKCCDAIGSASWIHGKTE